jgi:arylsulfatase A-like enzyme
VDETRNRQDGAGVNRRKFLGALGAAAAAGVVLQRGVGPARADTPQTYYYEDSFGSVLPCASDTIAAGVYPPPFGTPAPAQGGDAARRSGGSRLKPRTEEGGSCGTAGTTYIQCGYTQPNILLIMVDQLRAPRWLPSGGQDAIDDLLPNIAYLRQNSFAFQNYFVAATNCSPSRATLLTGLYSQQTCMFVTQDEPASGNYPPSLLPYSQGGFPTIGGVLSQTLEYGDGSASTSYDTAWIGKWHLSANPLEPSASGSCYQGGDGPTDYGFTNPYCIPNTNPSNGFGKDEAYPSPNGMQSEGNGGDFLDGYDVPDYTAPTFPSGETPTAPDRYLQLNDAAIAYAFTTFWAESIPSSPWFLAVSFVNPHDISYFPFSYALTGEAGSVCSGNICAPAYPLTTNFQYGYLPPPTAGGTFSGSACSGPCETTTIPAYDSSLYTAAPPDVNSNVPWSYTDDPAGLPYSTYNATTEQYGKPGLQAYFEGVAANNGGSVNSDSLDRWLEFLNYYFWMQACVDGQIHQIVALLQADGANNAPWNNTVVIFTSDHGDYGGSHNLHQKGGALYDESINVPLYVSYPAQRKNNTGTTRSYVCSSVDMVPLVYSLALGNNSWRSNSSDIVGYLNGRESILDAIFEGDSVALQRRLAPGIYCSGTNPNGQTNQPYILHTTDEFPSAGGAPSHAIGFRTVDVTVNPAGSGTYGGGKLGIYSFWASCATTPVADPGSGSYPQYEFYDYTTIHTAYPSGNYAETGNQGPSSVSESGETTLGTKAAGYHSSFTSDTAQDELYSVPTALASAYEAALNAYLAYIGGCSESCGS